MKEEEIVQKLHLLNQIQPEKKWITRTKREILGPAVSPSVFLGLFLIPLIVWGGIFYYNQTNLLKLAQEKNDLELVVLNLEKIKKETLLTRQNLKEINDPKEILALKEKIEENKKIVQQTKERISQLKETQPEKISQETLLVLAGAEAEIEKTKESYIKKQRILIGQLISEIDNYYDFLTEEQKALFNEGEKNYQEKNYSQSLEKLIQVKDSIANNE
jgi:hypothetical protein